jgi:hypothetical protein
MDPNHPNRTASVSKRLFCCKLSFELLCRFNPWSKGVKSVIDVVVCLPGVVASNLELGLVVFLEGAICLLSSRFPAPHFLF